MISTFNEQLESELSQLNIEAEILDYKLFIDEDPEATICFNDKYIETIANSLKTNFGLDNIAIRATSVAKMNNFVPSFAGELKVENHTNKPNVFKVKGLIPIINCFALIITNNLK